MRYYVMCCLMGLSCVGTLSAQATQSIAILDLEGRGISAVEAASLTDRLRNALVRSRGVTVVERGQMEQILSEQDFQLTGCTSDECAVEVGQLLGVTAMVAGSIGKVGATYSIDIRTVDVQSGRITHSLWRDYRGEIDGLLGIMPEIAAELVSAITTTEPSTPGPLTPASITIITQPSGVIVMLDGLDAGATPLEGAELEPNQSHTVSLRLDGYQPVDTTLFAETGRSYELSIPMARLASRLTVTSAPSGAMVFLDNRRLRITPLDIPDLAPDTQHQVSLRLAGYLPGDTTFFAIAGEHHQLNVTLQPVEVAETTVKPPETPPRETQQPQPSVKPEKKRGGVWVVLAALAATGYYGYTQGWFDEQPPDEGLRVGDPPRVPAE